MDDELLSQTTKPFYTHIHKITLSTQPNPSAEQTLIILQGFPFDEGTQINGGRAGAERGPLAFRAALEQSHHYPFETMDKISLYDNGDIPHSMTDAALALPEAHKVLQNTVQSLYNFHNTIPFVVGGSNDQSYPNAKGLITAFPKTRVGVINLDAHFDVRPLKDGKAHSGSPFRLLLEDPDYSGKFVEFASQGSQCSKAHYDYIMSKGGQVFWLEKDIRRFGIDNNHKFLKTQAGQVMDKILRELEKEVDYVFFSFDIDSINSTSCPGVSAPSVIGGLTYEEAIELAYLAGKCGKVKLMDVSEFNPSVENKKTPQLIVDLLYNFSKGVSERGV